MAPTRPKRILILEDDETIIPVIKGALLAIEPDMDIEWVKTAEEIIENLQLIEFRISNGKLSAMAEMGDRMLARKSEVGPDCAGLCECSHAA